LRKQQSTYIILNRKLKDETRGVWETVRFPCSEETRAVGNLKTHCSSFFKDDTKSKLLYSKLELSGCLDHHKSEMDKALQNEIVYQLCECVLCCLPEQLPHTRCVGSANPTENIALLKTNELTSFMSHS